MAAGYSKRSLTQKLGLKEGYIIVLLNHPEDYGQLLHPIPNGSSVYDTLQKDSDFIQIFTKEKNELEKLFPEAKKSLKPNGSLWISWPKKSSGNTVIARKKTTKQSPTISDLNENIIREVGLANGLVDVKVIAVDENWSGLKFVYRIKDRAN